MCTAAQHAAMEIKNLCIKYCLDDQPRKAFGFKAEGLSLIMKEAEKIATKRLISMPGAAFRIAEILQFNSPFRADCGSMRAVMKTVKFGALPVGQIPRV